MLKRMIAGVGLVLALVLAGGAQGQERPKSFPKVDLLPGSMPYYAPVMLDTETNTTGYVLFDGNVSNGYERVYFWSPDDPAYRTPKMFRFNAETRRFGPVRFTPKHGKDDIKLDWWFSWGRHGGAYEHFDYLTGQTRKGVSAVYPRFTFFCDYARQPRSGARGESLVDITMSGEINASVWTNMPAALQPWHTLNFYMGVKLLREKDGTQAHFDGRLNYGNSRCEVRSLPRDTVCTLVVAPYMGQPVLSNDLTWSEALVKGVNTKLDYGWYDLSWNMTCPGLRVRPRLDPAVRASPYPISRYED
jgi:hypothetical protein